MSRLNDYEVTLYCNNQVPAIGCDCNNVFLFFHKYCIYIVTTKCLAVILVVIVIVYLQQRVSVV